jgi:TorA maturation chaperone TorD
MKYGTVNVLQTYSPELSTDFKIPEDHLLVKLLLCKLVDFRHESVPRLDFSQRVATLLNRQY